MSPKVSHESSYHLIGNGQENENRATLRFLGSNKASNHPGLCHGSLDFTLTSWETSKMASWGMFIALKLRAKKWFHGLIYWATVILWQKHLASIHSNDCLRTGSSLGVFWVNLD